MHDSNEYYQFQKCNNSNSTPDEEPSQMSMQNGPRWAPIFNAVPSNFSRVIYFYPECLPRSPAVIQFPMFATHTLFFSQKNRQADTERNQGPPLHIMQLQLSVHAVLASSHQPPSPFSYQELYSMASSSTSLSQTKVKPSASNRLWHIKLVNKTIADVAFSKCHRNYRAS